VNFYKGALPLPTLPNFHPSRKSFRISTSENFPDAFESRLTEDGLLWSTVARLSITLQKRTGTLEKPAAQVYRYVPKEFQELLGDAIRKRQLIISVTLKFLGLSKADVYS
jgi:hypothetical protein